jgi:hypothetical protein
MPVSPNDFSAIFSATLFEEIIAETNKHVSKRINEAMALKIFHFGRVGSIISLPKG